MSFEDDLAAPVWDELDGHSGQKPVEELTETFDSLKPNLRNDQELNHGINDSGFEERGHVEQPDNGFETTGILNEIPTSSKLASSIDLTEDEPVWRPNDEKTTQLETKDHLINILAPETDLLSDLKESVRDTNQNFIKDDALFRDSGFSPIKVSDSTTSIPPVFESPKTITKFSNKPNVLFSSARLRRRPLDASQKQNSEPNSILTSDPLSEINNKSHQNKNGNASNLDENDTGKLHHNIINELEMPLFPVSPIKERSRDKLDKKSEFHVDDKQQNHVNLKEETDEEVEDLEFVKFEIQVKDPIKVGELTSAHVEYTISANASILEGNFSQVNRRYSDFRWLYRQLQNNHWGKIVPSPPEKQAVRRFNHDFTESRRLQMESMLKKIADNPVLQRDPDFMLFLTSSNFPLESNKREYATGSNASNDSNDLSDIHISEIGLFGPEDGAIVIKNGGVDGEQNKSFMSLSFSSQPKYEEKDEYFTLQLQSLVALEDQLRQIYKSLELVNKERNDLAFVTYEFANTMDSLANLEVTKDSSTILKSFAEVHRKIRESLERVSSQESVTLGLTLDDYIRSITSVRAIFNQRARLGYYLVVIENDYGKVKAQLERLQTNTSHKASERSKGLQQEKDVLSKRRKSIKKNWQIVGETIKEEINAFEVEKVKEFRNNIEIFLEASIEAQKESIELWETFYHNNL